jgi:hypothetical protein
MAELPTDQPQNTDELSEPRRGRGTWALWLLALPVLYVLSSGPMAKVDTTFNFPKNQPTLERGLEIIYWPVAWCATHSSHFQRFLTWYWGDVWHVKM